MIAAAHVAAAGHLVRRAVQNSPSTEPMTELEPPAWAPLLILADFFLFVPLWLFVGYTICAVLPALAMVEDENPPAYEPLATTGDHADRSDLENHSTNKNATTPAPIGSRAVTASFRQTTRLIRSGPGGVGGFIRGLPVFVFNSVALLVLQSFFWVILPTSLGMIAFVLASLLLVQFSTAWVHTVMTPQSPLPFWRRLQPFGRVFEATWRPTLLSMLAHAIGTMAPLLVVSTVDFGRVPQPGEAPDGALAWKSLLLVASGLLQVFITIPADVILTRIQASLLPTDHETIIPFDRTFEGRVEPEIVSGKGWASVTDAWKSFTPSAWRRLVLMYAKILLVTIGAWIITFAVLVPEAIIIMLNSTEKQLD